MDAALTIQKLADAAGVSVRTIRYYIAEGLLPPPGARGKAATYGEDHLLRLRLIRRLVEQRRPLAEIRGQLSALTREELRGLAAEEERRAWQLGSPEQPLTPRQYIAALLERERDGAERARQSVERPEPRSSSTAKAVRRAEEWERWELAAGVELHVRADAKLASRDLIQRLLREADRSLGREE
jgi:DNA-binding transcriptional MerR regulator